MFYSTKHTVTLSLGKIEPDIPAVKVECCILNSSSDVWKAIDAQIIFNHDSHIETKLGNQYFGESSVTKPSVFGICDAIFELALIEL